MAPQQGNITQYTSPVDSLRPDSTGDEALARAGRSIGGLYKEEGQTYRQAIDSTAGPLAKIADNHEYMDEVSTGSAALAAMHKNFTTQWNQMASKADPNDKSIQGTFLDNTVEPGLQQWQDHFSTEKGQQWALSQADQMRMHYTEKTTADMMTRAGDARVLDFKTMANQLSDVAKADHTSIDQSLNQIDATLAATKEANQGLLSPEQIDKLDSISHDMKNEVVKSGLQGWADKNPQQAVSAINGKVYDSYISGSEKEQLTKYAEGVTRMKLEDQQRAYEQQQRVQKMQEEAVANKIMNQVYNPTTGELTIPPNLNQQIFADKTLSAKAKIDIIGAVKHMSQDTDVTDPATRSENFKALASDSLTQSDLIAQAGAGKLSKEDLSFFNERLKQTPDALAEKGALSNAMQQVQKSILTTAAPGIPPSPTQRQNQIAFTNWFMPAYTAALQDPSFKGMSLAQKSQILLSSTDPKGLLRPEKLAPFLATPQQVLQDALKNIGPLPSQGGAR